jgi:hypothetical protein
VGSRSSVRLTVAAIGGAILAAVVVSSAGADQAVIPRDDVPPTLTSDVQSATNSDPYQTFHVQADDVGSGLKSISFSSPQGPYWEYNAYSPVTFGCTGDAGSTCPASYNVALAYNGLNPGTDTIHVVATDANGNSTAQDYTLSYSPIDAPFPPLNVDYPKLSDSDTAPVKPGDYGTVHLPDPRAPKVTTPSAKLRLLSERARSFGSDRVRYVVYVDDVPGKQGASPVVIVDTAKRMSRHTVRPPCIVGGVPLAMTPGFLLACSRQGQTVLVDLAHRSFLRVPSWFDIGGVPQPAEFVEIGRQWLQGVVGCPDGTPDCVAYENWHTGEQRLEGPLGVVPRDLDDPGLGASRPACSPFERASRYQRDGRHVLLHRGVSLALGRCGRADVLPLYPAGFGSETLAAGFVSWSGGTSSCSHTVYGYDIKTRRTVRWAVPHVPGRPSCGIVLHTANGVMIGSSVFASTSGIDTYRLYITRRP